MVILKELEIKHCFALKHVTLNFETQNHTTIFNGSSGLEGKLIYAIKSFFCKDTLRCKGGCTPACQHASSLIRIKFTCKSWNGNCIVVDAARLFSQSNVVLYYFDDKQYIESFKVFRERCQLNVMFYSVSTVDVYSILMQYCNCDSYNRNLGEILAYYLRVSNRWQTSRHQQVTKYIQISSLIDKELELSRKRLFVDVINEIGEIFKYITCEEYSVQFVIPLFEKRINIKDMNWDCMNLSKTEAWVTKNNSNISCIISELEPGLKEIMKISQTIALGKHLKRKCIFIENITVLEKYQSRELIKEAIARTIHTSLETGSTRKNFMGRIVDICKRFEISIFIKCTGRLPVLPPYVNIVQCNNCDTNTDEPIYVRIE